MKKTLILVITLLICVTTMLTLTACHECVWSENWSADTDTHYHECTVDDCDKITDQSEHVWKSELTTGVDTHYYECTTEGCPVKFQESAHNYDQQVESPDYLQQEATATTNATYLYSCVCGKPGTSTFEKEKPLAEVSIREECLSYFGREYDNDYTYFSKYYIDDFPNEATLHTYYKPLGADDSEYQLQGDNVAEDAGKYVMKVVIGETVDTAETVLYHEFEITKITGVFNYKRVWTYYNSTTSHSQLFTHHLYEYVVNGYSFNVNFTTASELPGVYSTDSGTLIIESDNPNYVLSGSIEVRDKGISSVTATAEYEEDGIYTVKLGADQDVVGGDEVYLTVNASNKNEVGKTYYVYYTPTTNGDAVIFVSLTGEHADNYELWKGGIDGRYAIKFKIVADTE